MQAAERDVPVQFDIQNKYNQVAAHFPSDLDGTTVLEVGGTTENPAAANILPGVNVVSANVPDEPHNRRPTVIFDGQNLPFATGAVPLTFSVDALEHEFPFRREQIINECIRASNGVTVISVPIHSKQNVKNEIDFLDLQNKRGMESKRSIYEHRLLGLPLLKDLVEAARKSGYAFRLYPSTDSDTLFQSLEDQVEVLSIGATEQNQQIVKRMVENMEKRLASSDLPNWEDAYRAILVVDKNHKGKLITDENQLFLSRNEPMAYQAALRAAHWGNISEEDVFSYYKENPLRGRNIVVEGPEGTGKTTLVKRLTKRLMDAGYDSAIQTNHGLRQRMRDMEKGMNRVINDPERGEFFAFAMIEAAVAGNAFSLLGPNFISINDRGIESVRMHHGLHCPTNVTIPRMLNEQHPLRIPPDLTIVLRMPDAVKNFHFMQLEGDIVNSTKGPEALAFQRKYYEDLVFKGGTEFTGPVCCLTNSGEEGALDEIEEQAMEAIEHYCGIPLRKRN